MYGYGGKGCDPTQFMNRVEKASKKFIGFIKKDGFSEVRNMKSVDAILENVFYQHFRRDIQYIDTMSPEHGQIKAFENHLAALQRSLRAETFENGFMNWMYNTSARVKKFPYMAKLYEDLGRAEHDYKSRQYDHNKTFSDIVSSLKGHAKWAGYMDEGFSFKKAKWKADQLELEIEKAARDAWEHKNNPQEYVEANNRLKMLLKEENRFYAADDGRVFKEFIDLIEGTTKVVNGETIPVGLKGAAEMIENQYLVHHRNARENTIKELKKGKYEYTEQEIKEILSKDQRLLKLDEDLETIIAGLTKSPDLRVGLKKYVKMQDDMHRVLELGTKATIKSMVTTLKDYNLGEAINPKSGKSYISEIETKLLDKLMPNKEAGYYPHYHRVLLMDYLDGLMPKMQAIQDKMGDSLKMDKKGIQEAIVNMHSYVNAHASKRMDIKTTNAEDGPLYTEYSKNFVSNIQRYVNEIDRFNYIANVDKFSKLALSEIKKNFRGGIETDGIASDAVKMIYEMNQAAKGGKGTKFENPQLEKFAQMALGMEFVSKIGFNPRSAGFNATQYLLNLVEYGPTMMKKSHDFYKDRDIKILVEDMLYDSGLLFTEGSAELEEISGFGAAGKISKFKVHGKNVDFVEPTRLDMYQGIVGKAPKYGGYMMGKVENALRKSTFKIGFFKHYDSLTKDTFYQDALRKEGLNDSQIRQRILSESRNAAINAVGLLHFNYSAKSKAKWLRDPRFRFLGQFQHYAMKMIEYNMEVAKGAGNDYMEKKLLGSGAMRAYRMGTIYFLMPAIASAVTGIEWGNMIENSTATRLQQLYTLFTGEDEEIEKAFYGRGPLLGSLGAPIFSDLMKMGQIMEWYEMDEDSKLALITGFNDYGDATGDEQAYEMARILNTSISRQYYQNFPLLAGGKIGSALQYELGLYPTASAKAKKKKLAELAPGVEEGLAQLIEHAKKGKFHK